MKDIQGLNQENIPYNEDEGLYFVWDETTSLWHIVTDIYLYLVQELLFVGKKFIGKMQWMGEKWCNKGNKLVEQGVNRQQFFGSFIIVVFF